MAFEIGKNNEGNRHRFPEPDLSGNNFHEQSFDLELPMGKMKGTQWIFDGIRMSYGESLLHQPTILDWKGDSEGITMHFNLQGKVSMQGTGMPRAFELDTNEHNMFFGHEANGQMKVDELQLKTFLIQFSSESFFAIAGNGNDALKRFADQVAAGRPAAFSDSNLDIGFELQNCISAILNCQYAEPLKKMYFFSKTIEMLVLQAEAFDKTANRQTSYVKKSYDRERILFARDYILNHIESPPTLPALAKIAGINEFKLKKGFKEIFGQTVFEYLSGVRLEMAKTDLITKGKSITEIAFQLGYSSVQHFSTAFKKKFNVPPSKV